MSYKISGSKYAAMFGPTTGDKVRLADTSLIIEVEKDYTSYGDEAKFGGGKTLRDGMGQSVKTCSSDGDLDLVITNALVIDYTGIFKADIGVKNGKIVGIGKAGNPVQTKREGRQIRGLARSCSMGTFHWRCNSNSIGILQDTPVLDNSPVVCGQICKIPRLEPALWININTTYYEQHTIETNPLRGNHNADSSSVGL